MGRRRLTHETAWRQQREKTAKDIRTAIQMHILTLKMLAKAQKLTEK